MPGLNAAASELTAIQFCKNIFHLVFDVSAEYHAAAAIACFEYERAVIGYVVGVIKNITVICVVYLNMKTVQVKLLSTVQVSYIVCILSELSVFLKYRQIVPFFTAVFNNIIINRGVINAVYGDPIRISINGIESPDVILMRMCENPCINVVIVHLYGITDARLVACPSAVNYEKMSGAVFKSIEACLAARKVRVLCDRPSAVLSCIMHDICCDTCKNNHHYKYWH